MEKNIINSGQCKTQSEVLEKMEIKIRTPLTGIFFQDDRPKQYNGFYKDGTILSGMELVRYEDAIQEAVDRENGLEEGTVCNLMEYFDGSVSVKEKVKQVAVSVEMWAAFYMAVPRCRSRESWKRTNCRNSVNISLPSTTMDGEKVSDRGISR